MSKRNIYILYAMACLQGMVFYGPIATLYRQVHGVTIFQITLIESISLALGLVLELPWGIIADKIGYKRTMEFCSVLYLVSKVVFWQAEGFTGFLVERILLSVVISGLSGVETAVLYLSCGKDGSQTVFGVYNSLQTVGLLFAAWVYSTFVGEDYPLAGLLTVIGYGAAAILSVFLTEVSEEKAEAMGAREFFTLIKARLGDKSLIPFLLAVAFLNETHQTITVFLNQLEYEVCGLSPRIMGYIYMIVTLAGLTGVWSEKVRIRLGADGSAAVYYGAAVAACVVLAALDHALLSILAILTLRVVFSLFQPLQTALQNQGVVSANRATELSVNALLIDSVGLGTNLAFGKLAEWDLSAAFWLGAALCLIGGVLFRVWYRQSLPA